MREKINKRKLSLTILILAVVNVMLASYDSKYKGFLLLFSLSITLMQTVWSWDEAKEQYLYFVKPNNQDNISFAGFFSYAAIFLLIIALYLLGSGFKELARVMLIPFVGCSFLSAIFICFELDRSFLDKITTPLRWVFGVSTPLIYYSASALANSVFLQISTMEMSKSPWVAFLLTMAFFIVFFSIFVQFVYYALILFPNAKVEQHQTIIGMVILGAFTLLMNVIVLATGNLVYFSVDKGIRFEWRQSALCAGNNMKNDEGYYYFGFNAEKYIAYRKDDKNFFFDELTCQKQESGEYVFTKANISWEKIPRWFKK